MRRILFGVPLLLLAVLLAGPRPGAFAGLKDDGRVGSVFELSGTALVSPAGHDRWTRLTPDSLLMPGDRVRTLERGANALEIRMAGGGHLVLGPDALAELVEPGRIRFLSGEMEATGATGAPLRITGPGDQVVEVEEKAHWLRARDRNLAVLGAAPRWLTGYRESSTTEWMGSLVADVDGRNVPLTIGYHKVSVVIRDQIAQTTVEESFRNATDATLEGTFTFPLPADASISGFGMWIGEQFVAADIVERGRARQIYEDILKKKKDPGLLEWAGGNLFKARVYPIPAHGEKRIRIRYTQVLPLEGTKLRYRYALRSDLLRAHPLESLSIDVSVDSTLPIAAAGCPSHAATVHRTEHQAKIEYDATGVTPKRDFEVQVDLAGVSPLTVIPHRRGPDGYFLLLLAPPDPAASGWRRQLTPEGRPLDLMLLADTSGSMGPDQREAQETFLAALLSLMGPKDTFRLGAVDRGVTWLADEPRAATEQNRKEALAFLAARDSLGWTDLDRALAEAAGRAGPDTQVIYVGDGIGTAGDPDSSALLGRIARIAERAPGTWHSVSTGSSYDAPVMQAIGAIGGGSVSPAGPDPAGAAASLLDRIARPPVKDLKVEFTGVRTARVYPARLPNLPPGTEQVVLGRFLPVGGEAHGTVVVTGTLGGEPVRYSAPFALNEGESGNSFLPRLWARRYIDDLLSRPLTRESREEIVSFSSEFGIMTPLTSFLVLESDADRSAYGVGHHVAMRDGERFFADAKDRVATEMLRQAMQKAAAWRQHLRERALAEIRQLGRGLLGPQYDGYSYAYAYLGDDENRAIGIGGGAGALFGVRDYQPPGSGAPAPARELYEGDRGVDDYKSEVLRKELKSEARGFTAAAGEVPPGERTPRDPFPPPAAGKPLSGGGIPAFSDRPFDGPAGPGGYRGRNERRFEDGAEAAARSRPGLLDRLDFESRSGSSYEDYRGWTVNAVMQLFPPLSPAPSPLTELPAPKWSREVLDLLGALDQSDALAALDGGLSIARTRERVHPLRKTIESESTTVGVANGRVWGYRQSRDGRIPVYSFCGEKMRGAYREGVELGRERSAEAADRRSWASVPGAYLAHPTRSYGDWNAAVESREGDRVTIRLTRSDREDSLVFVLDAAHHWPLAMRSERAGRTTVATRYSDWKVARGIRFPGTVATFDEQGHPTAVTRVAVEEVDAEQVAQEVSGAVAKTRAGLFLGAANPTLKVAKQAVHDGKATFADDLVVALDFAARQQWDPALATFETARKAAPGKVGVDWLHVQLASFARRGEQLDAELLTRAKGLAGLAPDVATGLGHELLGIANRTLGPNERLAVIERLDGTGGSEAWRDELARRRAEMLVAVGRVDEALDVYRARLRERPDDPARAVAVARTLSRLGRGGEAIEVLVRSLTSDSVWLDAEASDVYRTLVDLLWSARRLTEVLDYAARWLAREPADQNAWQCRFTALLFSGQTRVLDREILTILATDPPQDPSPAEVARLDAAISFALGQGWNYYSRRLDERWVKPLGDLAVRLGRRPHDLGYSFFRIWNDWRFDQTDQRARVADALFSDLLDAGRVRKMSVDRLERLFRMFSLDRSRATEVQAKAVAAALLARLGEEKNAGAKRRTYGFLLQLYDQRKEEDAALDLIRRSLEDLPPEVRPRVTGALMVRLLHHDFAPGIEDEIFRRLPDLVPADAKPEVAAGIFSYQAQEIAIGLERMRAAAALGTPATRAKWSRAELRARTAEARHDACAALADRFAVEAVRASPLCRPWLEIESICFAAEAGDDPAEVEGRAREALLSPPGIPSPGLQRVFGERAGLVLDDLAVAENAPEGLATRVVEIVRERVAAADDTNRELRRYHLFRLLLALDRPDELEQTLADWVRPAEVASGYRIALGYLYAERGRLEKAVALFETVAKLDELRPDDYAVLADWYLARGEDARREKALDARYAGEQEYRLGQRLWEESSRIGKPGPGGVPPDLDPEILRVERVLLAKASRPENYLYQVFRLYEQTKDFRLLASLADGVVGHSPESVYPFLTQVWRQLRRVREEATLDEVAARIGSRRENLDTDTDRRALLYLSTLVLRQATEVKNRPEVHAEQALAALKAAFPTKFRAGEPLLLARFLESLDRIPDQELAAEQVRQLAELDRAADLKTPAGLEIASCYAKTLWRYQRHDEALDALGSALAARRIAGGGRLPAADFSAFGTRTGWLETLHRYPKAEAEVLAERERQTGATEKAWMTVRLFGVYSSAMRHRGEVSIGKGRELYTAAFALMKTALVDLPAASVDGVVGQIAGLGRAAAAVRIDGVPADLAAFARGELRAAMARAPDQEQNLWLRIARAVHDSGDQTLGLTLLTEKLESDPAWYGRVGRDGWTTFDSWLARWRKQGDAKGPIAARLGAVVDAELETQLRSGDGGASYFWDRRNRWFWAERAADFAAVAGRVAELYPDSPSIQFRTARYLWEALDRKKEAVAVLTRADQVAALAEEVRFRLALWLQELGRHDEAIVELDRLLAANPDRLDVRIHLVQSLHATKADEKGRALVADTEKRFREQGRWNRTAFAGLADACLAAEYWEPGAKYYEETVRDVEGQQRAGRNDPGALAHAYGGLARCRIHLGREAEAVQAATAAVVAFGHNSAQRAHALESLRKVVTGLSDLDAFVAKHDAEVDASGLDAPVIRKTLGRVYLDRKEWAKAVTELRIARELAPADAEVHALLVRALDGAGDPAGALRALTDSLAASAGDAGLTLELARRLTAAGRNEEAERAYTNLVETEPLEAAGHSRLAEVREREKRLPDAVEQRKIAKRLRAFDPKVWADLVKTLRVAGEQKAADAVLEEMRHRGWGEETKAAKKLIQSLSR